MMYTIQIFKLQGRTSIDMQTVNWTSKVCANIVCLVSWCWQCTFRLLV